MTSTFRRVSLISIVLLLLAAASLAARASLQEKPDAGIIDAECSVDESSASMYRGDKQRSGVYSADGIAPRGEMKWKFEPEKRGASSTLVTGPSFGEDVIFFSSDYLDYSSAGTTEVYALDADSGDVRWVHETKGIAYTPAVLDKTVYVGCDDCSPSSKGQVYALDTESGNELWSFEAEYSSSSPVVSGCTLYFSSSESGEGYGKTFDEGIVYALDTGTGTEKWRFQPEFTAGTPAVDDTTVYFNSFQYTIWGGGGTGRPPSYIYALDKETGGEKWRFESEYSMGQPVVYDNTVFVGSPPGNSGAGGGILYALDAETGEERWRFESEYSMGQPVVYDNTVFVGGSRYSHEGAEGLILALNRETGKEKWRFKPMLDAGPPVYADGALYFISGDTEYVFEQHSPIYEGYLYSLDAGTGKELWTHHIIGISSTPVVNNGMVYIGNSTPGPILLPLDESGLYAIE